ncbi:MAG: glycosyltransferase family 4 protein [Pseudanabaenaceae cyanobacterium bins.39]|nr:glycosyltransferase family 4 protein [Pseudanabaenaceae cyanobacterium bins.39]
MALSIKNQERRHNTLPKILHLLSDRNVGGIKSTSGSLTNSRLKEKFEFLFLTESEALKNLSQIKPDVVIWHDPCNWRSLWRLLKLRFATKLLIHEHHYSESFEQWKVRSPWRFHIMLRFAYGLAHQVVAISQGQQKWMRSHRLVNLQKLTTIQQCRTLDEFLNLPLKSIDTPLVFGAYGRFNQQKGFDTLLRAMPKVDHSQIQLLVGGYGEQEDLLKSLAGNDSRIQFLGSITDVPSFLEKCDVIIIPSNWEPWGNVCLESKAAAKAVIVSQVDGLTEQVNGCGLLVPANNPEALAAAITQVCTMPRSQIESWGLQGRMDVQNDWEEYMTAWEALLLDLCNR